jgi:hypothetical protein
MTPRLALGARPPVRQSFSEGGSPGAATSVGLPMLVVNSGRPVRVRLPTIPPLPEPWFNRLLEPVYYGEPDDNSPSPGGEGRGEGGRILSPFTFLLAFGLYSLAFPSAGRSEGETNGRLPVNFPLKKLGSAPAPGAAADALVRRRERARASSHRFFLNQHPQGAPAFIKLMERPA